MRRIKIVAAGKIKDRALAEMIGEYVKRLGKFCSLEIIETQDESVPAFAGAETIQKHLRVEAERLLDRIKPGAYVISLDISGKEPDSPALAKMIDGLAATAAELVFVIGGSHGLHREVLNRSNYVMSLSKLTFPHQLARLILLEQLFRSFKIINNETYHK
jgi:23S rRNA (pseudouridine1915-N3)-methyltransferase